MSALKDRQSTFAKNVALLILEIYNRKCTCTLGEAWRPPEMASINVQKGTGIKNSLHIQRLAIDLNIFTPEGLLLNTNEGYKPFGDYWLTLNSDNHWGGNFTHLQDPYHFSMGDGVTNTQ